MKLALYASYVKDNRFHEMQLLAPLTLEQIELMMKYGSEWENAMDIGPLDVSAIDSLTLTLRKVDE